MDRSALIRLNSAVEGVERAGRIDCGLIRISTVTRLAVGYSTRTAADHRTLLTEPAISSMPVECLTPKIEDRAVELQRVLQTFGTGWGSARSDHYLRIPADRAVGG
jgi:predicted nucleic acid-binding protein